MTFLDQLKAERQIMAELSNDLIIIDNKFHNARQRLEIVGKAIAALDRLIEAYKKEGELMENDLGRW